MGNPDIYKDVICPHCHASLNYNENTIICTSCKREYSLINDIPDFRDKKQYWCNITHEKIIELNKLAIESGDWLKAAKEIVPQYLGHFVPFCRADSQFIWPCEKDSKILDAGSMWGGITVPAAQFHSEVFAVDKTVETLGFLKIRAQQMGFNNIRVIAAELNALPFPDNYFDLVVLNGVLEWVAFDEELVLEKHWRKYGRGVKTGKRVKYSENPRIVQLKVLREIQRVIKPGGALYLAIENRIGYVYLAGYPDDHMNIPFICFLPRFIANMITKILLGCEYRTYVYTIPGYKSLLKQGGFGYIDFYGAFMHYINPSEFIPLDMIKVMKRKILSSKRGMHKMLINVFPKSLLKWVSPSIGAIAIKNKTRAEKEPRLVQLLKKAGIINNEVSDIRLVKCDSRSGNEQPVNFWVYSDSKVTPRYFCKVCRSKELTHILDMESKNLKMVGDIIKNTDLEKSVAKLLYYGSIDKITFLVMEYVDSQRSAFDFGSRLRTKLRSLDKEIMKGIEFLVKFQKYTQVRQVEAVSYMDSFLKDREILLERRNALTNDIKDTIQWLKKDMERFKGLTIPLSGQHGDYDLFYNISFNNGNVQLFDFEHFEREGLPFLDLATLVFNPILVSYEHKNTGSLSAVLNKYDLKHNINKWFGLYAKLSGIPEDLLRYVPHFAALEQKTKEYPSYRNPDTFPINMAFEELMRREVLSDGSKDL